jgi:hypothetical protein
MRRIGLVVLAVLVLCVVGFTLLVNAANTQGSTPSEIRVELKNGL